MPDQFDTSLLCGWIGADSTQQLLAGTMPSLSQAAPWLSTAPTGQVLLYKVMEELFLDPNYPAQQIGDCTGFGNSHCLDLLMCLDAYLGDMPYAGIHETCTEFSYSVGREIAGILGSGDGGYGAAVAKGMCTVGVLPRGAVGTYSGQRARQWGRTGAPADMKTEAAAYKVQSSAQVENTDQAITLLNSGHPFSICTAIGFNLQRDQDGFCHRSGRWGHCMFVSAYRTDKPGFLIHQSWGRNMPTGPTVFAQPDWTFWCDVPTMAGILAEGDSWALSGPKGFIKQYLPNALKVA